MYDLLNGHYFQTQSLTKFSEILLTLAFDENKFEIDLIQTMIPLGNNNCWRTLAKCNYN